MFDEVEFFARLCSQLSSVEVDLEVYLLWKKTSKSFVEENISRSAVKEDFLLFFERRIFPGEDLCEIRRSPSGLLWNKKTLSMSSMKEDFRHVSSSFSIKKYSMKQEDLKNFSERRRPPALLRKKKMISSSSIKKFPYILWKKKTSRFSMEEEDLLGFYDNMPAPSPGLIWQNTSSRYSMTKDLQVLYGRRTS